MAFRLFKHEWVGTDYPNHDENDVKDCVKKLIDPLVAGGCGWSYDETHCPNSEPIKLIPSNRVFAAFIKHTSGAKAMIGYSLNGFYNGDYDTDDTYTDAAFLKSKIYVTTASSYTNYSKIVSLFFAFITADSVNNNGSDFHTEYSTLDENFYDSQMSEIYTLAYSLGVSTASSRYQSNPMIKNVTDNNICKHYIMADTEYPILYLASRYNNNGLKQAMFGEIADGQKRYDYDIRDTSKFRCLLGGGNETQNSSLYGERTIEPNTSDSDPEWLNGTTCVRSFTINGESFYSTCPRYNNSTWMTTTPRLAAYVFDDYRVWNSNIRCVYQEGLNQCQIYDNGQWCCMGNLASKTSYIRSFKVNYDSQSSATYTIIVKWDSEFNQGLRLV